MFVFCVFLLQDTTRKIIFFSKYLVILYDLYHLYKLHELYLQNFTTCYYVECNSMISHGFDQPLALKLYALALWIEIIVVCRKLINADHTNPYK